MVIVNFFSVDFDEDGALDEKDLMIVIDKLTQSENTGNEIAVENKKHIIKIVSKNHNNKTLFFIIFCFQLLKEFDLESNGAISPLEFQHAVGKIPEFAHSFSFRF